MRYLLLLCCLLALCTTPSHAQQALGSAVSYGKRRVDFDPKEYKAQLTQVNDYLRHFTTLQSRFTQNTGEGGLSSGMAYIKRPGKSRWEYANPSPALLIINGDKLTFYDIELQQVTYSDVPDTPLKLLLDKDFNLFSDAIHVLDVKDEHETLTIVLTPEKNVRGNKLGFEELTMIFAQKPLTLARVYVTDKDNHTSTIEFQQPQFDIPLDDALFVFKDTRAHKPRQ